MHMWLNGERGCWKGWASKQTKFFFLPFSMPATDVQIKWQCLNEVVETFLFIFSASLRPMFRINLMSSLYSELKTLDTPNQLYHDLVRNVHRVAGLLPVHLLRLP